MPADNPFVGARRWRAAGDLVVRLAQPMAIQLRSDPALGGTGALVIGDVGQNNWEEIDYEPRGAGGRNYGWRIREGAQLNPNAAAQTPAPAYQPLIDPIHQYSHSEGQSISGGYVYRGTALGADFRGRYFFADYVRQRVWSLGLSLGPGGEASAAGLIEHTAELGGGAAARQRQRLRHRPVRGALHREPQPRRRAAAVHRPDGADRAEDHSLIRLRASRYGETNVRKLTRFRAGLYTFAQ